MKRISPRKIHDLSNYKNTQKSRIKMSAFENMFPIFKDRAGGSVKIEALMGSIFLGGESMRVDPTHYKISFLVIFRLLTSIDRHHGDNDNTEKKLCSCCCEQKLPTP